MGDLWRPGDRVSAAKLNRNSASTGAISYSGSGSFDRTGNSWGVSEPTVNGVESYWVSVDAENSFTYQLGGSTEGVRTIYKYSWTEVRFDRTYGIWTKAGKSGTYDCDPLMNFDPTQKIPLTEEPAYSTFSSAPVVKNVIPVMREPISGQLFFFS